MPTGSPVRELPSRGQKVSSHLGKREGAGKKGWGETEIVMLDQDLGEKPREKQTSVTETDLRKKEAIFQTRTAEEKKED